MPNLSRALLCLTMGFLLIGAGDPPAPDVIIAQRGEIHLTQTDLNDALGLLDPAARAQVTASPQSLSNFVRQRMLDLAVLAEAKAKGWDSHADVMRRMTEAANTVVVQSYLTAQVPPDATYPSEADVTAAYDTNKAHLMLPRQFHLAQIVLSVKPGATAQDDEAAHKKAIDLRAQVTRPKADFGEIAKKNSQDPTSADKGGDVGWLREPDLTPVVRDAIVGLAENGISQPVRAPDGWHILKLLEVKPAGEVPFLDAKPQIVQALRQARSQRLMRAYLDDMLKTRPIEVNEIELTKQAGPPK